MSVMTYQPGRQTTPGEKLRIRKEIDPLLWEAFVDAHPNGNIFQTPGMFQFFSTIPGYRPVVLAAEDENNIIQGVLTGVIQKEAGLIRSNFSSRLILWGGPLTLPGRWNVTDALLKSLVNNYQRQSIFFEFRNLFGMEAQKESFESNGFQYQDHLSFIIPTADRKVVEEKMQSGKRRQIRKSLEKGCRIISDVNEQQVLQFYQLLLDLYQKKVHKPLPPWDFFKNFLNSPWLGKYFLIEFRGEIIGGIMCPVYKDKVIYEWYIAGADGQHEGLYPSVLATWAPIDYALNMKIAGFDFLGAGKPDQDYGVRSFKAAFGGELVSHGRFNRINNPILFQVGKTGLRLMKAMKRL